MAINWDDPANTNADIAKAPPTERPLLEARVPKIIPKGIAPTISGKISLAPVQNSP
jgi:hypothetical protein